MCTASLLTLAGETKTVVEKTEEVMSTASESSVKAADVKKVKGTK